MDPVVHFEMPYDDAARVAKFYQAVFGWKMNNMGEQMGHYVLAGTTQSSADGRPKTPGHINGGFFPRKADWPDQIPSVVIGVGDIRKAMAAVASSGGSVLGDPMDIPGVGAYVSFRDSEGNRVGILQPMAMPKAKAKPAAKEKAAAKKKPAAKKKGKNSPRKKARRR